MGQRSALVWWLNLWNREKREWNLNKWWNRVRESLAISVISLKKLICHGRLHRTSFSFFISLSLSLQLIKEEKNKWPYRLPSLINTPQIQYSIIFPSINLNLASNYLPNQISLPSPPPSSPEILLETPPYATSPITGPEQSKRRPLFLSDSPILCRLYRNWKKLCNCQILRSNEFFRNSSSANEPNTNFNRAPYFAAGNLLTSLAGKTHLAGNYRNSGDL